MTDLGTTGIVARAAIARICDAPLPPLELLEQVARRVRSVVHYAAAGWLLTDPVTMLHTGTFTEDVPRELQRGLIENELTADDVGKFSAIASSPRPVLQLADATAGELPRSARYRSLYAPAGYGHELRVAFRTGAACWAVACLARAAGEPEFDAAEIDFIAAVATDVGRGVRAALLTDRHTSDDAQRGGAGMLVLDARGRIESLTGEAERWLADLPADGLELPGVIYEVAERSRSGTAGAPARARVRSSSGGWLVVEGARLHGSDQASLRTAIVIQPAHRGDLAPLLAVAYGLTEREQELAQLLARGPAIETIATGMGISRHTVRDHVKAIFAKLEVTSRAELTALLFYEHVLPAFRQRTVPGS